MQAPFSHVDRKALARDVAALRAEEEARLGWDDFRHLRRRAWLGRALSAAGYLSAPLGPNPLSMAALAAGSTLRFTIVAHHVMHRSMDRIQGVPRRYTSKGFAKGARRWVDWMDWILPEAWDVEHNVLHHYATGELADPDLVEENVAGLEGKPFAVRAAVAGFYALTWKLTYYAPSTYQILWRGQQRAARGEAQNRRADARGADAYLRAFDVRTRAGRAFVRRCVLPYLGARFAAPTLLASALGPWSALSMASNLVGAELLANLHTFLIIAPNHAGDDLYRFDDRHASVGELYLRQIVGSANFPHGPLRDLLSGYLGYQIEHHLFPDLPPSSLERLAPRVRELCQRHGIPYAQEPVRTRAARLLRIMTGKARMRRADTKAEFAPASAAAAE